MWKVIIITTEFSETAELQCRKSITYIEFNKPHEDVAVHELLLRFEETFLENARTNTLKVVSWGINRKLRNVWQSDF